MTQTQEDSGKSSITLDMDQTREIRWNFGAMQKFERRSKDLLKREGTIQPNTQVHTGFVLINYLKPMEILEAAVAAATGLNGLEGKKGEPSEAAAAIQGYLDRGGDLDTLRRELLHGYMVVNDPSLVGEWEAGISREREARRVNAEKEAAKLEMVRMELADALKNVEEKRKASGREQAELPT